MGVNRNIAIEDIKERDDATLCILYINLFIFTYIHEKMAS
jgi:hypothetical protein